MTEQPAKRLDDYIELGRYVVCICILAELMILPQVSSMVYMMYAGASPSLASCEDGRIFDSGLEEKEWNHFCGNSKAIKNSISIQMLGVLGGSLVFGQISDLFGRRKGLLGTMAGMAVGWVFVAKSATLTQFTIARTVVGFFCGGSIA
ncbi:hypothetical protein ANCDUO_02465 [Ancylostoma duodenale]|uniref:Major facilitator superfamily (MFS) profile domain-containing protein n=1 Tax=Ancylostoma duodenale TaxID=51022 RepID=A0A0C2H6Q8_9BILA|nr:hypothetical protein ANCDUO_02465 [Ancylostoma duodenale]